jgi:alpha-pyrone synthase
MRARILNITTEVPSYRCSQADIFESFAKTFQNNEKYKNIFLHSGISTRHTVLENPAAYFYEQRRSTRDRNEIYQKHAYDLCSKAIERCLSETGTSPQEIDDLIIVSCTGVNIPGLDILLAKKFSMRPDLQRTAILFMGCYAAFPALRKSLEYTNLRPGSKSLIVCVELCSLHFQYNETIENVVSSSIFADGCAVALIEATGENNKMPVIVDSLVHTQYDTTEHMAFILTDEGFQMNLSAYVPDILKVNAGDFIAALLEKNNLTKEDINYWLIHPGGIKIVNYLQQSLELSEEQVKYSKKVLNDYGNMSSATVLFVLNELLKENICKPGDNAIMMAFGPGLTMEAILLKWE